MLAVEVGAQYAQIRVGVVLSEALRADPEASTFFM